ncbi:MAG: 23S rRNA (guanine1835-N2)-methyltransferase [Myxococcota bacterium]|jgi:23S rRNA (guanine1835-N2)-methyltransferase
MDTSSPHIRPLEIDADRWILQRRPRRPTDVLQAWNTADSCLLRELRGREVIQADTSVAIVNDAFGALGVALASTGPQWWSDSHRAWRALTENLADNDVDGTTIRHVRGDEAPTGPIDVVVLKIPKSMATFEDQLLRLRPHLAEDAQVIAGSMIKNTPKRAYDLLEACIGPTTTSLGWKKARLAFSSHNPALVCAGGLAPKPSVVPGWDLPLESRPGVFSWEKLDHGARLLLDHLDGLRVTGPRPVVVDLGCGNGVLAFALAKLYPDANIVGIDESYQAIASAQDNSVSHGFDTGRVRFVVADELGEVGLSDVTAIVCNPPFHHGHVVGDHLAVDLFHQSRKALRPGGTLLVVGNGHLRHHDILERLFATSVVVAANPKFTVVRAIL